MLSHALTLVIHKYKDTQIQMLSRALTLVTQKYKHTQLHKYKTISVTHTHNSHTQIHKYKNT